MQIGEVPLVRLLLFESLSPSLVLVAHYYFVFMCTSWSPHGIWRFRYPNPSEFTYEKRFFRPFEDALQPPLCYKTEHTAVNKPEVPFGEPGLMPYAGPQCFAIPGNHDWFDGLQTFMRHICHRSWLELTRNEVGENDSVIIMTHEPNWLLDWYGNNVSGKRVSHLIRDHLKESNFKEFYGTSYECKAAYPSFEDSGKIALGNIFKFRKMNWQFDFIGGIIYFILVFSMFPWWQQFFRPFTSVMEESGNNWDSSCFCSHGCSTHSDVVDGTWS
ncbi:hypothetical protein NE237_017438 [Protea cynaroides]|uniref:Calcineurin-like phosphoesterase domain-containing protein n=1 Tax=Protea cynaroides TaxID=273540 RepID=A0A9Q0K801_9MAGN|nr:hypothetical protein NE237_017438 [Protea cynaroides]